MDEVFELMELLKSQTSLRFVESAIKAQIRNFETKCSVMLPTAYEEWLLLSDGGECFLPVGIQFYGVVHEPIIDLSDSDRPDDSYVVIGRFAFGDPICFKTGEEKIVIYNSHAGCIEDDEVYENFIVFMKEMLDELRLDE